jgi:phosphoserine phosphatase
VVIASRFPRPPFETPLVEAGVLSSTGKVAAVDTLRRRLRIGWRQVVAYGDGPTDLPLFGQAGLAVAIGTNPAAVEAADISYPGRDLREAYRLVRRASDGPGRRRQAWTADAASR